MVKTKLKPVLPSLREKKRYLAFEVISYEKIYDSAKISAAISLSVAQLLGHLGAAKAGVIVLENKWDAERQRGILKTSHKHVDAVKASLIFANKIDDKEVIFRSTGVSGILNKVERKYLKAA